MFYDVLGCPGEVMEKPWKSLGEILDKSSSSAGEVLERLCGSSLIMEKSWKVMWTSLIGGGFDPMLVSYF